MIKLGHRLLFSRADGFSDNHYLYAFTNRQRNKIKCLFWEDNGFVLYYKSLSEDKFHWPKPDEELVTLTGQQLNWLLDGYNLNAMQPHKKRHYESCF